MQKYKIQTLGLIEYYQIKGVGWFAFVPIIVLYILVPLVNYSSFLYFHDMDILYSNIIQTTQFLCPLCSVWYVLFILYHYVEQQGCEILYVGHKYILGNLSVVYCFSVLLLLPLFGVYYSMYSDMWWLYGKIVIVDLLYMLIAYAAAYWSGKIVISIVVLLCYSIFVVMSDMSEVKGIIYYSPHIKVGLQLFQELKEIILLEIILVIAGLMGNKRYYTLWENNRK